MFPPWIYVQLFGERKKPRPLIRWFLSDSTKLCVIIIVNKPLEDLFIRLRKGKFPSSFSFRRSIRFPSCHSDTSSLPFFRYLSLSLFLSSVFFHLCLLSPQKNDKNDDGSWKIGFSDAKANRERTRSRVVFTSGREKNFTRRVFSRQTFISQFPQTWRNEKREREHATILR